jgi:hypothetical protein
MGGAGVSWAKLKERYKNDPEYLEMLAEQRRTRERERYARKKEQKNNGSAGNSADSNSVSGRGRMSHNNDNSDKELSERTLRAADSSSEGGVQTTSLSDGERQLGGVS